MKSPASHVIVSCDDKTLIADGTFLSVGGHDTKITVSYEGDSLALILAFPEDGANAIKGSPSAELLTPDTVKLTFGAASTGYLQEPREVGTIAGRTAFVGYCVERIGRSSCRRITYSFYVGKEAGNG